MDFVLWKLKLGDDRVIGARIDQNPECTIASQLISE